jgi:YidC/Oxa1 family membrane protein insertase
LLNYCFIISAGQICIPIPTFAAQFFAGIMKMDKNTVIGVVLLAILFFAFFYYTNKQQKAILAEKEHTEDSIRRVEALKVKPVDTAIAKLDSAHRDSALKTAAAGNFGSAGIGTESFTVVENNLLKATFSNKGGALKSVELKNYKSVDSGKLVTLAGDSSTIGYSINTSASQSSETSDLYFGTPQIAKAANGAQTITYTVSSSGGQSITHQYVLLPDSYLIDWNISVNGANQLLTGNLMNLHWNIKMHQQQSARVYEKEQSRICYYDESGYDYTRLTNSASKDFDKPLQWLSFKQQFFNTTILSKNKFSAVHADAVAEPDTSNQLFAANANMRIQVPAASTATVALQLYYGPNDYKVLKGLDNGMENIVDLGSGMFSFVKYINRWIIIPVFNFISGLISNYGLVILLLTLFIRLVTSPLTYSSYLSGAKMKVMRPELDELKKKFGSDQQGFAMEQMKLFREAGVNPLGGCIPALLQIPIFFSLYSFFSSNIALRGQSFLWIKDLSSYDVLVHLSFTVPFGFGDHISLFTLTAVATSFLISIYNMAMTPQQDNPAMKYMPYIFPFILLFVFNRLPSALTWYYTVSNLITLGLQFVIQNYIIDHNKILAQIEQKRKAPKTQSKFQERYQQMMDAQKKVQDMKQKNQNRK